MLLPCRLKSPQLPRVSCQRAGVVYRLLYVLPKHERRVRLPPPAPAFATSWLRLGKPVIVQPPSPMKNIRFLLALAVASFVTAALVNAEETKKEAAHPAGTEAKCCLTAEKNHEKCNHECCVAAGKAGKKCEKCGGTNEAKK